MKSIQDLVSVWFEIWDKGNYQELPISSDFKHHSPYGTIDGKEAYMDLIVANKDKFLGNKIELEDSLFDEDKACVRYTIHNPGFSMVVSEWIYAKDGLITEIFAYYNIEGEISEGRKLKEG